MSMSSRLSAAVAYIPVIGWLYVLLVQRGDVLARFHLRQSVGLYLFLVAALAAWIIIGFLLALIPLMAVVSAALFTIVIAAFLYGLVALLMGLSNALRGRTNPLPVFGQRASRLPI